MKKAWLVGLSVIGLVGLMSFAGCKSGSEASPFPDKDTGRDSPNPVANCEVIAEQADFDRFEKEENGIFQGFLIQPGATETCTRTVTINGQTTSTTKSGYSTFHVAQPPRAAGQVSFEEGSLKIAYEWDEFSPALQEAFADKFGAARELVKGNGVFRKDFQRPSQVLIPGLPVLEIRESYESEQSFFIFSGRALKNEDASISKWVEDFNAGRSGLRVLFRFSGKSGTPARNIFVPAFSNLNTLEFLGAAPLVLELWSRIDAIAPEFQDEERNRTIRMALARAEELKKVFNAGLAARFEPLASFARKNWKPSPELSFEKAAQELENLEFATLFSSKPIEALRPYYDRLIRLRPWLGFDSLSLLREIKEIVERGGLTEEQEAFVIRVAEKMKRVSRQDSVWENAKSVARRVDWQEGLVFLVIEVVAAISSDQWNSELFLSAAVDWVKNRGLERAQIPLLKAALSWLTDYDGPRFHLDQALRKTGELVFDQKFNSARLELLKAVFSWMKSYDGPYVRDTSDALAQSSIFVARPDWNEASFKALQDTFAWLVSYEGPYIRNKSDALKRASDYTLDQKFASAQLNVLKEVFAWVVSYEGPYVRDKDQALKKAESFASAAAFQASTLQLAKSTFEWLVSYEGPYMRDKAAAYDKCIDFVLSRKLTRDQLQLLTKSFAWLVSWDGPSLRDKGQALTKGESWVFTKGLSPKLLQKLQDSFASRRRQGMDAERALAAAEQEVLN